MLPDVPVTAPSPDPSSHPVAAGDDVALAQHVQPPPDEAWVCAVYPKLHHAAWAMTGDATAAEDLAQETLLAAIENWDRFRGTSNRDAWAHGILIRLSRKRFRTLARFRRRLQQRWRKHPQRQSDPDTSDVVATREWNQSVWSHVAKLPRRQAEAITLRFAKEMTYDEIAEALDCASGTAKSRVHHGLQRLRTLMGTDDLTDELPPTP